MSFKMPRKNVQIKNLEVYFRSFLRREQTLSKYLIVPHYGMGSSVRDIDAEKP